MKRREPLRRRNPERLRRLRAAQFGEQAELCRRSLCCVPHCTLGPPCDPAHHPSRAAGGLDKDTVPLCRTHHSEQHAIGVKTFQALHGIDLKAIASSMSDLL